MIYSYIKQQLSPLETKPAEYFEALNQAQAEIQLLRERYSKTWTYCAGCKGYAKVAEAYESEIGHLGRYVLRCGTCNSIWKYLD